MSPDQLNGLFVLIGSLMALFISGIWLLNPPETMEQSLKEQLEEMK